MFKIILSVLLISSIALGFAKSDSSFNEKQSTPKPSAIKIKCCVKLFLPVIKLKRPKKNCERGFGLCVKDAYACILCNFDGTAPDCVKCESRVAQGEIEVTGMIDRETNFVTLNFPESIKNAPELTGEDLSVFYVDEAVRLFDKSDNSLKATLKTGVYPVTEEGGSLKVVIPME